MGRPLEALPRGLLLRLASPDGAAPTLPPTVVAWTYEVAESRSPVVPPATLAARVACGVAVTRMTATRPYTRAVLAIPILITAETESATMQAIEVGARAAAPEAPLLMVTTVSGAATAEAGAVVPDRPSTEGVVTLTARGIPRIPRRRRVPTAALPILAREVVVELPLVRRNVMETPVTRIRGPFLRLLSSQTRRDGAVVGRDIARPLIPRTATA